MAKKKARTKFAGTRVDNEMDRWLRRYGRAHKLRRGQIVMVGLNWLRAEDIAMAEQTQPACSCSPDDRNKNGCTCAAGVGR